MAQRFEDILAGFQEPYTKAKSFANYTPEPDGAYTIRVKELATGVSDEKHEPWMKLICTIEQHPDPSINGKEWGAFFFGVKTFGQLKDFMGVAAGIVPDSLVQAFTYLNQLPGSLLLVDKKTVLTKTKKEVANVKLLRVIETTVPATPVAA